MQHFLFLSLFFSLIACNSNSSSVTENTTDVDTIQSDSSSNKLQTIESFILDGHEVLAKKKMDFNNDGFEDMVLILKNDQEAKISDYANDKPTPRPLLFLAGNAHNSFQLVARNDKAVYCVDCGGQMGDPFNTLLVDKQFVSIEYYGGSQTRWTRITTFYYNNEKKDWFLYEDGTETFKASNHQKVIHTNKQTSLIPFKNFDIYQ